MGMRKMDSTVVEEVTKEEVEVVELVKDMDKLFSITTVSQVILRETARTHDMYVL